MYKLYFVDRFDSEFETFDGAWKRYTQILELDVKYDSIKIIFEPQVS
jgi:hypothetical protein